MTLILYSGPQCSLCDDAVELLYEVDQDIVFEKVNIRDSHELYHLYGARIPVLKRTDSNSELGWPFSKDDIKSFLQ
ncbi:MAG: glutaredoxin family protein [Pseudomonadota bacterium]